MTIFVYYRFLTLRYASRRNRFTRETFTQLRIVTENYIQKPSCPQVVRNLATKMIALITRLAPVSAQQPSDQ